jgi:hypothetical protein
VRLLRNSLENLGSEIPEATYPFTFSRKYLQTLGETPKAIQNLYRISKPGALGIHEISFEVARDPARPLDYLLLERGEFQTLFERTRGRCGNRLRVHEFTELIQKSGFLISSFQIQKNADPVYLCDFRWRLEKEATYSIPTEEALSVLEAGFVIQHP